ncbi:hypothetical protein MPL1032_180205 [Mesorhizobium plurifarium]|uniref:Uncharacterized protein n=1 Tax=Mesorhizobium plurifarium TaxID=69974 RepID=A0A0K2VUK4_MESPL|nr:hypothetical protein MPL1032_180205 [Mesorhizobium plurifarium]
MAARQHRSRCADHRFRSDQWLSTRAIAAPARLWRAPGAREPSPLVFGKLRRSRPFGFAPWRGQPLRAETAAALWAALSFLSAPSRRRGVGGSPF